MLQIAWAGLVLVILVNLLLDCYKYELLGKDGLKDTSKYMGYSDELKARAVEDYLFGDMSLLDICRKYKISSKTALIEWIQ